jgi:hypothetical protein
MDLFKKKVKEFVEENFKTETTMPEEEWIWVEGYKGTEKDMTCNGFQYAFDCTFSMPKDDVDMCTSGFHLCKDLKDVYKYYTISNDRRYFKVRALVKKTDLDKYGTSEYIDGGYYFASRYHHHDKLVAAEINFVEELTLEDIFKETWACNWPEKYKKLALSIGLDEANYQRKRDILIELGYSPAFANILCTKDLFEIAEAVGSQTDLSMDMKVWTIFKGE